MSRRAPLLNRILITLAVGVSITIALAWLAMFLPRGNAWYGPRTVQVLGIARGDDGRLWEISRGESAWHTTVAYSHMQISGMSIMIPEADYQSRRFDFCSLPRQLQPESLSELNMQAWYHQTGWPWPALACSVHWNTQVRNADIIYAVRGGVQLPRDASFNPRAVPLTPVWGGLVADAVVFAAAWLSILWAAGAARRRHRARRGRCPHCGYSRSGLASGTLCPECGRNRATGSRGTPAW
jgi:hypothetical protein